MRTASGALSLAALLISLVTVAFVLGLGLRLGGTNKTPTPTVPTTAPTTSTATISGKRVVTEQCLDGSELVKTYIGNKLVSQAVPGIQDPQHLLDAIKRCH